MRHMGMALTVTLVLLNATGSWADMGFDDRYERDYNIFNPITHIPAGQSLESRQCLQPGQSLQSGQPDDSGNPANPINQYQPNNPFNPVNRYRPDNPLNPINKYNPPPVPFAPLNWGGGNRNQGW